MFCLFNLCRNVEHRRKKLYITLGIALGIEYLPCENIKDVSRYFVVKLILYQTVTSKQKQSHAQSQCVLKVLLHSKI